MIFLSVHILYKHMFAASISSNISFLFGPPFSCSQLSQYILNDLLLLFYECQDLLSYFLLGTKVMIKFFYLVPALKNQKLKFFSLYTTLELYQALLKDLYHNLDKFICLHLFFSISI